MSPQMSPAGAALSPLPQWTLAAWGGGTAATPQVAQGSKGLRGGTAATQAAAPGSVFGLELEGAQPPLSLLEGAQPPLLLLGSGPTGPQGALPPLSQSD